MTLDELATQFRLAPQQAEVLNSITFNLEEVGVTARKDEERIRLFLLAVARKEAEYVAEVTLTMLQDPRAAEEVAREGRTFSLEASNLVRDWLATGLTAWKKLSLARLFGWDPFKELRQKTRSFAAEWDLDPVLREALG